MTAKRISNGQSSFLKEVLPRRNGCVFVLAGPMGIGKSAFARYWAWEMLKQGNTVTYLNAASARETVLQLMCCAKAAVPIHHVRSGTLTRREKNSLKSAADFLTPGRFSIVEVIDLPGVEAAITQAGSKVGLVVLDDFDQLQEMADPAQDLVKRTTERLKHLIHSLPCPLIVTVGTAYQKQRDQGVSPKLSSLGAYRIMDTVVDATLFPLRPTYYQPDLSAPLEEASIYVAKNRVGPTGAGPMWFRRDTASWTVPPIDRMN